MAADIKELKEGRSYIMLDLGRPIPSSTYRHYVAPFIQKGMPVRIASICSPELLRKEIFKDVNLERVDLLWITEMDATYLVNSNTKERAPNRYTDGTPIKIVQPKAEHIIAEFTKKPEQWGIKFPEGGDLECYLRVLDGLDFLVNDIGESTEKEFAHYLRVVKKIVDDTATNKSVFILPINPHVFDKKEITLFSRLGMEIIDAPII